MDWCLLRLGDLEERLDNDVVVAILFRKRCIAGTICYDRLKTSLLGCNDF